MVVYSAPYRKKPVAKITCLKKVVVIDGFSGLLPMFFVATVRFIGGVLNPQDREYPGGIIRSGFVGFKSVGMRIGGVFTV